MGRNRSVEYVWFPSATCDLMSSQRTSSLLSSQTKAGSFLSLLLPQSKKPPGKSPVHSGSSQLSQSPVLSGKRDGTNNQASKSKENSAPKDGKVPLSTAADPSTVQQRQKRMQDHEREPNTVQQRQRKVLDHEKERKELLSKHAAQGMEKKTESGSNEMDNPSSPEMAVDQLDSPTKLAKNSLERGSEQPFIVLSQEEYAEHHSSIMYCGPVCWLSCICELLKYSGGSLQFENCVDFFVQFHMWKGGLKGTLLAAFGFQLVSAGFNCVSLN
ncbi:WD repeat-containing protein 91-like [Heterodontus francisci]|uniref:WD repeat-containing protein 91-like n=1 Tax=Heterodontus francisci TaxID=7792 RepID=UPI00355AFBF6